MSCALWMTRILAIAGVGLALGAAHSWRQKVVLGEKPAATSAANTVGTPAAETDITLEQAKKMWDEGAAFIDARPERDFTAGHIANARHITPGGFNTPEAIEQLKFMDMEQPIVVYCTGGDCHDSHNLVALLRDYGFKKCLVLTDGYPAWEKAGYDIEKDATKSEGGK